MTTIRTITRTITTGATLAAIGLVGLGTTAASAHGDGDDDDDRVIVTGACSGGADWKLKVKTDDGRLEVEGEIDSNTVGQQWRWAIRHNGSVSDRGSATTTGRSGSFSIERRIVDIAGADRVVFRAVHDGQTCRGVVNY